MEEINFNGLNYNDSHLGDQINQALNEYNSLAKKISESKRDFAYKDPNKLNNYYNKYEFNLINKRKSPYITRKRDDFYNPHSYYRNYNRDNIMLNRNNETFFGTNDLIEEFKDTLEKSQIIKDDILKSTGPCFPADPAQKSRRHG